ncbi:MAG: Flp family type IVb pilin [Acidobacteriota bacterium]
MTKLLKRLWREEEGQDLTEYGLLLVLISLVAVVAIGSLGSEVNHMYSHAARRVLHRSADYR